MKIVKIRTLLVAAIAGGTGYVLGTKAGQTRYAELKVQADKLRAQADRLARSPQVRETVANVADKVRESAEKLPDPIADAVNKVADSATEATSASDGPTSPSPTTVAPATAAPDPDALEGDDPVSGIGGPPRPVV
ncbi:hypothetical protein SAMN04488543_0909 [Friedmanniella luteola]|uniref:YtxH-like protein n=1 Tax=Friedmanniella luteola TaxID=546871 RepID=A0A1H1NP45_9ACTN|nr:hypothetical protein [Friedmanniella luteola]SDS00752.1 hypothetical protein SAMN04488543_0909 [Friedmanniella luteola]